MEIINGIRNVADKNVKMKFKKVNMSTVFMNTVLLFCVIASLNFMTMFKADNTIEYSLKSKRSFASHDIDTYSVALYQDRYYSFSALESLKKYSNNLNISMMGEALQYSLLFLKR